MIPRGRLDLAWSDLAAGFYHCFRPGRRATAESGVEELSVGSGGFVCLSVRSGLDLVLTELALPGGSEVLVSAVTIRDMVRIIEGHGLVPVPVDVDMDTLTLDLASLRAAIGPRAKVLLVAHLFGSRMDMAPVAAVARQHGLVLVEDCAQSFMADGYWGHPDSDVALTSFGPIKSASALGGAVARVSDPDLLRSLRKRQAGYPVRGRWWFFKRLARFSVVRALMYPLPLSVFRSACRAAGKSHDDVLGRSIRGFGDSRLFEKIRHRPGYPLLALLARRLRHYGPAHIARRVATATAADAAMCTVERPGRRAESHGHWVFPVLTHDPEALAGRLWARGFDATRGRWSLYVVQEPEHLPQQRARKAHDVMRRLLYVPVYPGLRSRHVRRLAQIVVSSGSPLSSGSGIS